MKKNLVFFACLLALSISCRQTQSEADLLASLGISVRENAGTLDISLYHKDDKSKAIEHLSYKNASLMKSVTRSDENLFSLTLASSEENNPLYAGISFVRDFDNPLTEYYISNTSLNFNQYGNNLYETFDITLGGKNNTPRYQSITDSEKRYKLTIRKDDENVLEGDFSGNVIKYTTMGGSIVDTFFVTGKFSIRKSALK